MDRPNGIDADTGMEKHRSLWV